MAQQTIDLGTLGGADGTGDSIRTSVIKTNNNFTELFALPSVLSDITVIQNNINTTSSNADLVIKPSGAGAVLLAGLKFQGNNIETVNTNGDLRIVPNGSGFLVIDGIGFSGTTIHAPDSSIINIGEALNVDGTLNAGATNLAGTTINSTLGVTSTTTLSTLTVSGASSFAGVTTIDNLTFNDNIISTSSNADLNLTPGGTGVVNVSNITLDSSINLSDNIIKVIRSNDDFVLSANGTGSVQVSKIDMNQGTVDNTVIGATTPAAGTFTSISMSTPSISADGVTVTDNTIKANRSNDNLEFAANGSGNVVLEGIKFPNADGSANQVFKTDGSGNITYFTSPILFDVSDLTDGTATVLGNNSAAQLIDQFGIGDYRGVKYHLQISDATNDRYTLIEVNITHDSSTAFISSYGAATNGHGDGSTIYDSLDLSVDINSGNVRLLGQVNNTSNQVVKFIRRRIKV